MPYYDENLPEEVAVKDAVEYWQQRAEAAEARADALQAEVERLRATCKLWMYAFTLDFPDDAVVAAIDATDKAMPEMTD